MAADNSNSDEDAKTNIEPKEEIKLQQV